MKVYHERKSYATRTDEPPEKQAHGMGNGDWGLGNGDWRMENGERGSRKVLPPEGESIKSIIPIARLEPL